MLHKLHSISEAELAAADAARRRHQVAGGGRGGKDDHMSAWLMDEDGEMLSDYEDEEEDEDSDDDDMEGDDMDGSEDDPSHGALGSTAVGMSDDDDDDDDEAVDSSAADDAAAAAEWRRVRQAATEDRDYPDEVDVPVDVSARQRFARFRCCQ
jgi:pre-rRNA-processing protein TSR1